ncbi:MAG: acyltransferase [Actinobacteria bacterium]|nr:acyltransferase [Actinomycetota bacterium]
MASTAVPEVHTHASAPTSLPTDSPTLGRAGVRVRTGRHLQRPAPPMGYVPGLDGIRALAVLGVLVFHGSDSWLPGGFLGVDVFFVLSGFLISTILLEQLSSRGWIDFRVFYLHRARRLLPALVAMVAMSAVLIAVFAHDAAAQFRRTVLPSLLYVANWAFINDDLSYFEAIGRPPVLQHLWSLAIEEQFYLLWPLVLLLIYKRRGRLGVGRVAFGVAVVSTLLMALLSVLWNVPGQSDASRLYFGTDTHAMSLLVGAALAAVYRPGAMPRSLPLLRRLALTGVGVLALGLVILAYFQVSEQGTWLYRGGFLVFAFATAALITVVAHPAALLGPVMAWAPLRYIGTRSYGLYLYHWPIFVVLRPEIDVPMGAFGTFLLRMGLTMAVAEVSYRYLEMPIRRGTAWPALKQWFADAPARRIVAVVGTTAAATAAVVFVIANAEAPTAKEYLGGVTEVNAAPLAPKPTAEPAAAAPAVEEPTPTVAPEPITPATPMTVVGDSLAVGAAESLTALMPATTVDAAVSRQPEEVLARISERQAAGLLDPVVVIQTGTNGRVDPDQLSALLASLSDRQRVVLVTSAGPHSWQPQSNEVMQQVAAGHPNVRVADFAAAAAGHPEYFIEDGVHLTPTGLDVYTALITATVQAP